MASGFFSLLDDTAAIMDDVAVMSKKERSLSKTIGNLLVQALPKVIKSLAVIGTIALILVASGIFAHNIDFLQSFISTMATYRQRI